MSQLKENSVEVFCHNCKEGAYALRDSEGITQYICQKCGAMNVIRVMTRRSIKIDVVAPKGSKII